MRSARTEGAAVDEIEDEVLEALAGFAVGLHDFLDLALLGVVESAQWWLLWRMLSN